MDHASCQVVRVDAHVHVLPKHVFRGDSLSTSNFFTQSVSQSGFCSSLSFQFNTFQSNNFQLTHFKFNPIQSCSAQSYSIQNSPVHVLLKVSPSQCYSDTHNISLGFKQIDMLYLSALLYPKLWITNLSNNLDAAQMME